jgi:hypothetical protein
MFFLIGCSSVPILVSFLKIIYYFLEIVGYEEMGLLYVTVLDIGFSGF